MFTAARFNLFAPERHEHPKIVAAHWVGARSQVSHLTRPCLLHACPAQSHFGFMLDRGYAPCMNATRVALRVAGGSSVLPACAPVG